MIDNILLMICTSAFRNQLLLIFYFIGIILSSKIPFPTCRTKPIAQEIPLTINQLSSYPLSQFFDGYNLEFKLQGSSLEFAYISNKLQEVASSSFQYPNIISHYISNQFNYWGKQTFILYTTNDQKIIFGYGTIQNDSSIPVYQKIVVSAEPSIKCFDAVLLMSEGLGIIDCFKLQYGLYPKNFFIFVDLSNSKIIKIKENDCYAPFSTISKRKLMLSKNTVGQNIMIRGHLFDGVGSRGSQNTYLQIFSIFHPLDPFVLSIVDRSYLKQKILSIADIKVYFGKTYILDYSSGLIQLEFLPTRPRINGILKSPGYLKFDIYMNKIAGSFSVALARSNKVYHQDCTNINQPLLINKYDLPDNTKLKSISLNRNFLFVLACSTFQLQASEKCFTWIFSQSKRIYTDAFGVILNQDSSAQLILSKDNNRFMLSDIHKTSIYNIGDPVLYLTFPNNQRIGKKETLLIRATSEEPYSKRTMMCSIQNNIYFTQLSTQQIFKKFTPSTRQFYVNSPGRSIIPVSQYAGGADLTYKISKQGLQFQNEKIQTHKLNQMLLNIDFDPESVLFFFSQVFEAINNNNYIFYFVQDLKYDLTLYHCLEQEGKTKCIKQSKIALGSKIISFATNKFVFDGQYLLLFALVLENSSQIRIYDTFKFRLLKKINYEASQVSIQVLGSKNYLYILTNDHIDCYLIQECVQQNEDDCNPIFSLTPEDLSSQFWPTKITANELYQSILYLQNEEKLLIIQIDHKYQVSILNQFKFQTEKWQIAINSNYFAILTDTVKVYQIKYLTDSIQIQYIKLLPLYGFALNLNSSIFVSQNNFVYVDGLNSKTNKSTVLIYYLDQPTALSFYGSIQKNDGLGSDSLYINTISTDNDILTVKSSQSLRLYKIYRIPEIILQNLQDNSSFNIQISNSENNLDLGKFFFIPIDKISTKIVPSPQFHDILSNLDIENAGIYKLDDSPWLRGTVLGYNYSCDQCSQNNSKIKIDGHFQSREDINFMSSDIVYRENQMVTLSLDVVMWKTNGSISKIINIPRVSIFDNCNKLAVNQFFIVVGCQPLGLNSDLFIISKENQKNWVLGPYLTEIMNIKSLHIVDEIILVVENNLLSSNTIFVYSISYDDQILAELEVITQDDLINARGYDKENLQISNALLSKIENTLGTYLMFITEKYNGFFILAFQKKDRNIQQINIISIQFVDLRQLLFKYNFGLPAEIQFNDIVLVKTVTNPHFYIYSLIVGVKNFHSIEITIAIDDDGTVLSVVFSKIYYRYGSYSLQNIKYNSGYLVAAHQSIEQNINFISIYQVDECSNRAKGYCQNYLLSSYQQEKNYPLAFDVNITEVIQSKGESYSIVISQPQVYPGRTSTLKFSKYLILTIDPQYKAQNLTMIAWNQFQSFPFNIPIRTIEKEKTGFDPSLIFNRTYNNFGFLQAGLTILDDDSWFIGSVLKYNYSCSQCNQQSVNSKITFYDHLKKLQELNITATDYIQTKQASASIFKNEINIWDLNQKLINTIILPNKNCLKIASENVIQYILVACQQNINIRIYKILNPTSQNPNITDPTDIQIKQVATMAVKSDILMLASGFSQIDPRQNKVVLLSKAASQQIQPLKVQKIFGQQDLINSQGFIWKSVKISNADIGQNLGAEKQIYTIFISELNFGLFKITFSFISGEQIQILQKKFINVRISVKNAGLYMPTAATFQSVAYYEKGLILSTNGFHQIHLLLDSSGDEINLKVGCIYHRYGEYDAANVIRIREGYFAVAYTAPDEESYSQKTKQIVALYQIADGAKMEEGIQQKYMAASYLSWSKNPLVFGFMPQTSQLQEASSFGFVVTDPSAAEAKMAVLTYQSNLLFILKEGYKDQNITLTPWNDFESKSYNFIAFNFPSDSQVKPNQNTSKAIQSIKIKQKGNLDIDDSKWFNGSILQYNYTCQECGQSNSSKISLKNHLENSKMFGYTATDFITTEKGTVSLYKKSIRLTSIEGKQKLIELPNAQFNCLKVGSLDINLMIVAVCENEVKEQSIYFIQNPLKEANIFGPFKSQYYFHNLKEINFFGQVFLMFVDSQSVNTKGEKGKIVLATYNLTLHEMADAGLIEQSQLIHTFGYINKQVLISSADVHVVDTALSHIIITQVNSGLFIVKIGIEDSRITFITPKFFSLKPLFRTQNIFMPTAATFQSVAYYEKGLILSTNGFHQIHLLLDSSGDEINLKVGCIYHRYGEYDAANVIRIREGYFAVAYTAPDEESYSQKTKQIVALYQIADGAKMEEGIQQKYMAASYLSWSKNPLVFGFMPQTSQLQEASSFGFVVTDPSAAEAKMAVLTYQSNIMFILKEGYKDQNITLTPWNDFESRQYIIEVKSQNKGNSYLIIYLIVGVTILMFCIIGAILWRVKKSKKDNEKYSILTNKQSKVASIEPLLKEEISVQTTRGQNFESQTQGDRKQTVNQTNS